MAIDQLAWNLFSELRKETLESQKIRAQAIGFKITFVSAGAGLVVVNHAPLWLMLVLAYAAIFFDLLIASYNFGIMRISHYLRDYVEPKLIATSSWPEEDVVLWERYVSEPGNKRHLALVGNLGLTLLVSLSAVGLAIHTLGLLRATVPSLALAALLAYDIYCYLVPFRFKRPSASQRATSE